MSKNVQKLVASAMNPIQIKEKPTHISKKIYGYYSLSITRPNTKVEIPKGNRNPGADKMPYSSSVIPVSSIKLLFCIINPIMNLPTLLNIASNTRVNSKIDCSILLLYSD